MHWRLIDRSFVTFGEMVEEKYLSSNNDVSDPGNQGARLGGMCLLDEGDGPRTTNVHLPKNGGANADTSCPFGSLSFSFSFPFFFFSMMRRNEAFCSRRETGPLASNGKSIHVSRAEETCPTLPCQPCQRNRIGGSGTGCLL